MGTASSTHRVGSTQTARHTPQTRLAKNVAERTESVRLAIHNNSPRGFHGRVCAAMGWRAERPSREQNGAEKLSVELVLADAMLHQQEGNQDAAAEILAAFQRPLCPVIELRNGQIVMEFE